MGECGEGVGSAEFAEKLRELRSYESYLEEIRSSPVEVDQWQLEKLALAGLNHEILFYAPGIPGSALGALEQKHFSRIDNALSALFEDLPRQSRIAVVPDGPYAFAKVTSAVS